MGKSLLIALLIALSTSAVADVLYIPNRNGGEIVLTPQKCDKEPRLSSGYAVGGDGRLLWFCWTIADDKVLAVYEDATTYAYPIEKFRKRETNKPQAQPQVGKAL